MDSETTGKHARGAEHIEFELRGTTVRLLAGKAIYLPDQQTLCIADAHFGKAAAYRLLGQPVPGGTTATNLVRIDALLSRHSVAHLVFLGDLLHARGSITPSIHFALLDWRHRHPLLKCTLVRGNHDRHAGDPPADLLIDAVDEPLHVGPFALCHAPRVDMDLHVLAGHIHPVFNLRGNAYQRLRLPCFLSNDRVTVLPSFGEFTGGYQVDPAPEERVCVTDGSEIWLVRGGRSSVSQ